MPVWPRIKLSLTPCYIIASLVHNYYASASAPVIAVARGIMFSGRLSVQPILLVYAISQKLLDGNSSNLALTFIHIHQPFLVTTQEFKR